MHSAYHTKYKVLWKLIYWERNTGGKVSKSIGPFIHSFSSSWTMNLLIRIILNTWQINKGLLLCVCVIVYLCGPVSRPPLFFSITVFIFASYYSVCMNYDSLNPQPSTMCGGQKGERKKRLESNNNKHMCQLGRGFQS